MLGALGLLLVGAATAVLLVPELDELLATGDQKPLPAAAGAKPARNDEPSLLLIALDGIDRALLYAMLRNGELPGLAALLFARDGQWPHAHFDDTLLSTLPSSTLAAWATIFTGEPPARHGVTGNEFFIRETRELAAPAPVSILDPEPVLATYTDGYANKLLRMPTIYEQLRARRPNASIWVSMSQFHAGASRLLLADRTVVADAFQGLLDGVVSDEGAGVYAELDEEVVDTLLETLQEERAPHVITLYLTGADHYAHVHERGPDQARRSYLRTVVDPLLTRVRKALDAQRALDNRYVVVTSDHGHTPVVHDERHALSTEDEDDPPAVLRGAGFRLRPFELEVDEDHDFQAVLAYGGAMAYLYVADRSTCLQPEQRCDWTRPPRYDEDVLAAADAFYVANRNGKHAPGMKGTLDLILTRRPRPFAEDDLPFEVYVGERELEPLSSYLSAHPHPSYVAVEERLRDLAAGRFGERAGDVLLIAQNGDVERAEDRYYFAGLYHSWHGSPSRKDSEVPLIVAHARRSTRELGALARSALGAAPRQQDLAELLLRMLAPGSGGARAADAGDRASAPRQPQP
jgi:predicted AlkP superfamily pyrophosphatase or phosphodiesterase